MNQSDIKLSQFTSEELAEIYEAFGIPLITGEDHASFPHAKDRKLKDAIEQLIFLAVLIAYEAIDLSGDAPFPITVRGQETGQLRQEWFAWMEGAGEDGTFQSLNTNPRLVKLKSLILEKGWFGSCFV
jgi:hypothetical protein